MAPEADHDIKDDDEKNPRPLDEDDIALLKTYVIFPSFPFSFFLSFFLITNPNNNYVDLTFYFQLDSFIPAAIVLLCYVFMFEIGFLFFSYYNKIKLCW